jgi:KaiC/GvpD/RAD55 family RecA-like ATPase
LAGYSNFGSTGIDYLLGGGLLTSGSYLLESEPGTQELAFIASFLDAALHQKELCVIATHDVPHQELIRRLEQYLEVEEKKNLGALLILDLWTEAVDDYELNGPIWTTRNPRDLNTMRRLYFELACQIPQRIKNGNFGGARHVTCSLSSMIMNYKFEPTYKWTEIALDLARRSNVTTLTLFNSKMFDERVAAAFEHLHDGVIVLSMKELAGRFQRYVRIKKSPIPRFSTMIVPYDIVDMRPHLQKQPHNSDQAEDRYLPVGLGKTENENT